MVARLCADLQSHISGNVYNTLIDVNPGGPLGVRKILSQGSGAAGREVPQLTDLCECQEHLETCEDTFRAL